MPPDLIHNIFKEIAESDFAPFLRRVYVDDDYVDLLKAALEARRTQPGATATMEAGN